MSRVEVLLRRLEKIHTELGGNMAEEAVDKTDKFASLRCEIEAKLHSIEGTQEERKRTLESFHQ